MALAISPENSRGRKPTRQLRVVFAILVTCVGMTNTLAQDEQPEGEVVFEPLNLDDPVTCMDMSEDGKFLVFSHQGENKISVYDVLQQEVIASWNSPSPRSILIRSGDVIAGNRIDGTINVYSKARGWKSTGVLRVPKPGIVHIAAPRGRAFRNELIVTCHGEGVSASYQDSLIFVVNTKTGRFKPISKSALASVSYDGRIAIVQESFNLSSYGQITAHPYSEFVQRGGDARVLFKGGSRHQTPYAYQVASGGYWIGGNKVFGGIPLTQLGGDLGDIAIPDGSQKMVYSLTKDMVSAHQMNAAMTHINTRRVRYPEQYASDIEMLFNKWIDRSYLLDHPVAFTHGDRTHLFVRPVKGGLVLAAETPPFGRPGRTSRADRPEPRKADRVKPVEPRQPRPRTWSTDDGKFSVQAVLVQVSDAAVVLRRSDNGKIIAVPPKLLSQADRDYLATLNQSPTVESTADSSTDVDPPSVDDEAPAMATENVSPSASVLAGKLPSADEVGLEKLDDYTVRLKPFGEIGVPRPGVQWKLISKEPPVFVAENSDRSISLTLTVKPAVVESADRNALAESICAEAMKKLKLSDIDRRLAEVGNYSIVGVDNAVGSPLMSSFFGDTREVSLMTIFNDDYTYTFQLTSPDDDDMSLSNTITSFQTGAAAAEAAKIKIPDDVIRAVDEEIKMSRTILEMDGRAGAEKLIEYLAPPDELEQLKADPNQWNAVVSEFESSRMADLKHAFGGVNWTKAQYSADENSVLFPVPPLPVRYVKVNDRWVFEP